MPGSRLIKFSFKMRSSASKNSKTVSESGQILVNQAFREPVYFSVNLVCCVYEEILTMSDAVNCKHLDPFCFKRLLST